MITVNANIMLFAATKGLHVVTLFGFLEVGGSKGSHPKAHRMFMISYVAGPGMKNVTKKHESPKDRLIDLFGDWWMINWGGLCVHGVQPLHQPQV